MDKLVIGMVIGLAAIATLLTLMATQVGIGGGGFVDYTPENQVDDSDGCCGEIATIALVTIPEGASDSQSGKTFEPQTITVVIGVNNTVRWINQDTSMYFIEADNDRYDPAFYHATEIPSSNSKAEATDNVLMPNEYFEYTFTKPGEYGYHSKPWMRGTVIVMESR
jgi:plastocyanin